MSFVLSGKAKEDMVQIAEYGLVTFGEQQSAIYLKRLYQFFAELTENHERIRLREEYAPDVKAVCSDGKTFRYKCPYRISMTSSVALALKADLSLCPFN